MALAKRPLINHIPRSNISFKHVKHLRGKHSSESPHYIMTLFFEYGDILVESLCEYVQNTNQFTIRNEYYGISKTFELTKEEQDYCLPLFRARAALLNNPAVTTIPINAAVATFMNKIIIPFALSEEFREEAQVCEYATPPQPANKTPLFNEKGIAT